MHQIIMHQGEVIASLKPIQCSVHMFYTAPILQFDVHPFNFSLNVIRILADLNTHKHFTRQIIKQQCEVIASLKQIQCSAHMFHRAAI